MHSSDNRSGSAYSKMTSLKNRSLAIGIAFTAAVLQVGDADAQNLRTGASVYREICSTCHATGVGGAPRFGEVAEWKPLIAAGQPALTAEAWLGVRRMPAKGGRENLRLEEFARGVAFMVRAADIEWQDPDAAMMAFIEEEARRRAACLPAGC